MARWRQMGLVLAAALAPRPAAAGAFTPVNASDDGGTVAAEQRAPLRRVLPGAYAGLELRHATLRSYNDDQTVHNDSAGLYVIPKLGTTLFGDKVDTSFTYKFLKRASSDTVTKYDAYNETSWTVLDGKLPDGGSYNVGPYALVDLLAHGQETWQYAELGFFGELTLEAALPGGSLQLTTYVNPMVDVLSNQAANSYDRVPVTNNTDRGADELAGYGLANTGTAAEPNVVGVQKDDGYVANFGTGVRFLPAAVPGLALLIGIDFLETWTPFYVVNEVGGEPRQQLDHYAVQAVTINRLAVSYKLTDKVTVSESLRNYVGGFEQRSLSLGNPDQTGNFGPYRWENRLSLSATLL